jgi:acyl-CoA synthetase (AMP-forming)/AMP-acid ligase II
LSVSLLLDMAVSGDADREVVVCGDTRWSAAELDQLAYRGAGVIKARGVRNVAYVGTGGAMLPLLIFSAARAGVAFVPLNYRLSGDALRALLDRLAEPLIVVDSEYRDVVTGAGGCVIEANDFIATTSTAESESASCDPDDIAVVLFTSGTTSRAKAVELSHTNITSYITGTVDFFSANPLDAALISVPPYHIAGVSAALSNLYAGRKTVYLRRFDPIEWVRTVRHESVTTATVVPTMLDRIVTVLENQPTPLPSLRNLAYGGAKAPQPLIRKALDLLPEVGFVNAYGLTETSSTIAVLTPEDHKAAHLSSDETVARRLGSVGRVLPGVEIQIRSEHGNVLGVGQTGELFVRGDQVSGRYAEIGSVLDEQGWFPTKDLASTDEAGYLYIAGRSDDTIIRGGENIAPAELEDVLVEHPMVREVAVIGAEDPEWGQIIVAVVVPAAGTDPIPDELRAYVRANLRGSRTPDRIVFRDSLPTTATGKVLRRELVADLNAGTPLR